MCLLWICEHEKEKWKRICHLNMYLVKIIIIRHHYKHDIIFMRKKLTFIYNPSHKKVGAISIN